MLKQHQVGIVFGLFMRAIGAVRFLWKITPLMALLALAIVPLPRAKSSIDATVPSSGFVQFLHTAQRGTAAFPYRNVARDASANFARPSPGVIAVDDRSARRRIGDRWLEARSERAPLLLGERPAQRHVGDHALRGATSLHAESGRGVDLTTALASLAGNDAADASRGVMAMQGVMESAVDSAIDGATRRVAELQRDASRDTVSPLRLSPEQRNIARFVAKTYRVGIDDVQRIVAHAFRAAREFRIDPYLVLAVMSVESSFNPNARSTAGAQGLMQVLTRVHVEKFAPFGGTRLAFDPMVNINVGSRILKEYLVREGSVEGALKSYVGAAMLSHDFGYGSKVLSQRERIVAVAEGRPIPAVRRPPLRASRTLAASTDAKAAPGERIPASVPVDLPAPAAPIPIRSEAPVGMTPPAAPQQAYAIDSIAQSQDGLREL